MTDQATVAESASAALPDFLLDEEASVSASPASSVSAFDPVLRIAVCDHRTDKKYKNQSRPWSYLRDRNRTPIRTTETAEEYPRLPKSRRDILKDQGGFVGGWLREGIRRNGNVIGRQVAALDADCIPQLPGAA